MKGHDSHQINLGLLDTEVPQGAKRTQADPLISDEMQRLGYRVLLYSLRDDFKNFDDEKAGHRLVSRIYRVMDQERRTAKQPR